MRFIEVLKLNSKQLCCRQNEKMTTKLSQNNENWVIWLLAGVNFTNVLDFMIMMPLGPQLKRVFELSPTQWSSVVSSYTFAAFATGLLSVFIIDKFDRKKLLTYTYIGFTIGTFMCGVASDLVQLMIARSVAGIFGGVLGALALTVVGDVIPFEKRSKAVGKVMAGFSAAAALGVPMGLYLGTKFGWEMPFYITAFVSLVNLVLIQLKFPSIDAHLHIQDKPSVMSSVHTIVRDKNILIGLLFMGFLILGQFTIIPFLSPYMVANVGFKEEDLIYIYFTGGIITAVTSPLIGKIADKKGNKLVFTIFLFLSLIPLYLITNLENTPVIQVLPITVMFFVFAGGRMIPAMTLVMSTAEPRLRGIFMSIRSSIQHLFSGHGAVISGSIIFENSQHQYVNYHIVGFCAMAFSLSCLFLLKSLKSKG